MAGNQGGITKRTIDRILADYLGPPMRELGFRRQGGGGRWQRESEPGWQETVKTSASKRGPVEGIGNRFDLEYQVWPLTKRVSPFGHFLARLTPEQQERFLETDRRVTARFDHPEDYEVLWAAYADQESTGWEFRCLIEDDVHEWGRFIQPHLVDNYLSWWAERLRQLTG